jgi:hypothetical protein
VLAQPVGQPVGDLPAGDPDEPGAERAPLRVERLPAPPGADEHLLGDVFGVVVSLEAAQGDGEDHPAVAVVRLAQGGGVTGGEPPVQ